MLKIWKFITAWFESHGGFSHVVATVYIAVVAAYAAVPAFSQLINSAYSHTPSWLHQIAAAVVGLVAWYSNTKKVSNVK